jgi:Alginate export
VIVTGEADYNIATLPSQVHPDRPTINDPKSLELSQGFVEWRRRIAGRTFAVTAGRQEITLNDGRFLNFSAWRQVHGTFDAARADAELPLHLSFTYAYINRFYRQVGYEATDGHPLMHTHLWNLVWTKPDRARVAFYGLLLDYQAPEQFSMSTQTYGLRANGPYALGNEWKLLYTAEYAKQKNYGTNPNRVDANYYLGELGPEWRGFGVKAGYALLGGRTPTDKLSTPLAPPFNGYTDLFFLNPSGGGGNGLEARYLNASGPVQFLDGTMATFIFYDYHSDSLHVHYGREFDAQFVYKMKRVSSRWEVGWRFSRYWSIELFTPALRTSVFTSFTL